MYQKTKVKISEYIEMLNKGYFPQTIDNEHYFSNGETVGYFWHRRKHVVISELEQNPKYKEGYDMARKAVYSGRPIVFKGPLTGYQKMCEYIEKLNNGYVPKKEDKVETFSSGELVNFYWMVQKNKIMLELEQNPKYQMGYETAKEIAMNAMSINENMTRISRRTKIEEYIEKLNNGYIPKCCDKREKFSSGQIVNEFGRRNREKILLELNTNPKYKAGYETAKKMLEFNPKEEYIDLLNSGYKPKPNDLDNKFSNGEVIGRYWNVHRNAIRTHFKTHPKYQIGYDVARRIIFFNKMSEYIELLNQGYMPLNMDSKTLFFNGEEIGDYWGKNKIKIKQEILQNPKYQIGYETAINAIENCRAKKTMKPVVTKTTPSVIIKQESICSVKDLLENYKIDIGVLNNHMLRVNKLDIEPVVNLDDTLESYCLNNGFKYEIIQKAIKLGSFCMHDSLEQLINRVVVLESSTVKTKMPTWITERYGQNIKDRISFLQLNADSILKTMSEQIISIEDAIKEELFDINIMGLQFKYLKNSYLSIAKTIDRQPMIADMKQCFARITKKYLEYEDNYEPILQVLEKYIDVIYRLRLLEVGLEFNENERINKIKLYGLDEYDIEEACLIQFVFKNGNIIDESSSIYNRRQLLRQYAIDWDLYTEEEKQEIIKENKIGARELKLINDAIEKINEVKEKTKLLTKI